MTDITHYTAGLGKARSGMAWRGKAGLGVARTAGRNPCFIFKHDHYDKSYSRRGLARHGKARQGHRASKPCALYVKWDSHDEKRKS